MSLSVPVLFEGDGLLIVNKPAGVTVIPGRSEEAGPSLRERIEQERRAKIFVVHRLDRDTSGVLVFALDAETHRALSMAFEAGQISKRYLALVDGKVDAAVTVDAPLAPARRGRMRVARPGEEGKPATTKFSPRERFARATLVEAEPLTGRTHQIRVHLQSLSHPLLFDHQYGRKEPLRRCDLGSTGEEVVLARTPLHASWLKLPGWPKRAGGMECEAPLPPDMASTLELLRSGR